MDKWRVIQTTNGRVWRTKVMREVFHVKTFETVTKRGGGKLAKHLIEGQVDFPVEIEWL